MKKIKDNLENPIDFLIINYLCEPLSELIHNNFPNITPNMLTTIGLIFGILSIICLYKNLYIASFILFWISYFFDCLDGYYARKYNMVTQIGDYYDHIRDFIINIGIVILITSKLKSSNQKYIFVFILIILFIFMCVHLGCQEKIYNQNSILSNMTKLCPNEKYINITKYFGCGTYMLYVSIYLLYLKIN
jgi:phosphatidylglycerophosphate synthase